MSVYPKNATNSKRILELLILNGANVNLKNNDLWTPLHLAVKKNCYEASEALFEINESGGIQDFVDIDS